MERYHTTEEWVRNVNVCMLCPNMGVGAYGGTCLGGWGMGRRQTGQWIAVAGRGCVPVQAKDIQKQDSVRRDKGGQRRDKGYLWEIFLRGKALREKTRKEEQETIIIKKKNIVRTDNNRKHT